MRSRRWLPILIALILALTGAACQRQDDQRAIGATPTASSVQVTPTSTAAPTPTATASPMATATAEEAASPTPLYTEQTPYEHG
jgi:hypothetical protein